MSVFLKRLLSLLLLAAAVATGYLLWKSGDPFYTAQAWISRGRYWEYDRLIMDAAKKHRVNPLLLKAMVWRESSFHPGKMGTSGERGLLQVGEAAAEDWAKAGRIETFVPTDLFDPKTNLEVGAWYFAKAFERWKDRDDPLPFALAEYNAGRSRVDRWVVATNRGDEANAEQLMEAIDFPSTRRYVEEIVRRYRFYQDRGRM
ncbi:MAG TPA: transglycosylase SLT domain-containing protein [Chthoniobacteraceae bacterium]|jgi:soluble lytic murein transglycosylase|nr:transglycosylase SLT domain-containing protein [Chthoniobacteraceae bacterium]